MSQTTTAIYLFHGLDTERQKQPVQLWPDMGKDASWMEIPDTCDLMATVLERWYDAFAASGQCFPSHFDYEVTEEMGAWLYHNFNCTDADFTAELTRYVDKFIAEDKERVALWRENDARLKGTT